MAETTEISWCDCTFNGWIGCTKVSPACDHCYAARDNERRKWVDGWGPGVPRRRTSEANWRQPLRWNRKAEQTGERPRVFCSSLADVFDNEVPGAWRCDLFNLIRQTPNLRWIILTKRIGNARKMLPDNFGPALYPNVGLMATLENQEVWDRDFPKLMALPAAWRGVSAEPLLGPIDMAPLVSQLGTPEWMIVGGESGPLARPMNPDWARALLAQCRIFGITFHFKQWGSNIPDGEIKGRYRRVPKAVAGCSLDGVTHKHFPAELS